MRPQVEEYGATPILPEPIATEKPLLGNAVNLLAAVRIAAAIND
jgi:hypothetical protein